jgi:hypothetical protein
MSVTINGSTLASLGFTLTALPGWSDAPARRYGVTMLPGRVGGVQSTLWTSEPRVLSLTGIVEGSTATARRSALRAITAACAGTCSIVFADAPNQTLTGVLQAAPVLPFGPALEYAASMPSVVTLEFLCADPAFRDTTGTAVNLSSTPAAIQTGTLPHGGVCVITGAATNPILRYKDHDGATIAELGFTVTLGGGDTLTIDLDRLTVEHDDSGVVNGLPLWTSGDWFLIDPQHADYSGNDWPTLEVTSGTAVHTFKRAWAA